MAMVAVPTHKCKCTHIILTQMPASSQSDPHNFSPIYEITQSHQWRLLRGGRFIIMAGMEQMEWQQTPGNHGNHVFDVFDTIPLILFQSLPLATNLTHTHIHARRHTYLAHRSKMLIVM
jgi:hypothetical protein